MLGPGQRLGWEIQLGRPCPYLEVTGEGKMGRKERGIQIPNPPPPALS
jgi:hypothetical protein